MDLTQLIYIKNLLDKDVAEKTAAREVAYKAKEAAEDAAGVSWNTRTDRCPAEVQEARRVYNELNEALAEAEGVQAAFVFRDWK